MLQLEHCEAAFCLSVYFLTSKTGVPSNKDERILIIILLKRQICQYKRCF